MRHPVKIFIVIIIPALIITACHKDPVRPETPAGSWGGSGTATYEPLRLNQLTGWSRWLQTNLQKPLALYK